MATWGDFLLETDRDELGEESGVGALIVTPGAIKAEMDTVNAGVKQLDLDIMASNVRDAFKKSWRLFVGEWQAFYKARQSWTSRLWGSEYEKAVDFRRRLDGWRQALQREGGQSTAPALGLPQDALKKPSTTAWWFVGGAAAAVVLVVAAGRNR